MSTYLDLLKNWKSALAGGGTAFILVAIFTFITDMRTMSRGELDAALDMARADLLDERRKNETLSQEKARVQEAYETLAAAYWDEPVAGYLKGRNGRYIQANKKFIEDLVLSNGLDANQVIGYTDYEIWQDSARARINQAHEQEVIRNGHPMEFPEQYEIAGQMVEFLAKKYPLFSTRGYILGTGSMLIEDCE